MKPPTTFTAWVARRRGTSGDIGMLAGYLATDPKWPARSSDRYTLRQRLLTRHASEEVLDLFARVWEAWTAENKGGTVIGE